MSSQQGSTRKRNSAIDANVTDVTSVFWRGYSSPKEVRAAKRTWVRYERRQGAEELWDAMEDYFWRGFDDRSDWLQDCS